MPNGGSDCCGTCWFNRANEGKSGHPTSAHEVPSFCEIRGVAIGDPFWTYCANHPHHNPGRVDVPVGPIFVCDSYPYTRRKLLDCPDTTEIRSRLLDLLDAMPEVSHLEYPTATHFDEQLIDQLMAFREPRAIAGLRRVVGFNPTAKAKGEAFGRTRAITIGHAIEALATIAGDGAIVEIEACLNLGLVEAIASARYDPKADKLAPIRYHAVRGLQHCRAGRARSLLERAKEDPHPEIAAFAAEILRTWPERE